MNPVIALGKCLEWGMLRQRARDPQGSLRFDRTARRISETGGPSGYPHAALQRDGHRLGQVWSNVTATASILRFAQNMP